MSGSSGRSLRDEVVSIGLTVGCVDRYSRTGFTHSDQRNRVFHAHLWIATKYFGKNPVSDCPCVQNYWYINNINDVAKCMSVKELETAIMNLSVQELSELTAWLIEYRQQVWDRQIEEDLDGGRLDALLNEVDAEYEAGLAKVL